MDTQQITSSEQIGEKVKADQKSFNFGPRAALYTRYLPQIMVNGNIHYLSDAATSSGLVECLSWSDAYNLVLRVSDESKEKLNKRASDITQIVPP